MLHLWRPTPDVIEAARGAAADAPYSYEPVGATRGAMPDGFRHDAQSVILGQGDLVFARARMALLAGRMFDQSWVTLDHASFDVHAGSPLVYVSHQLGLYTLNACRILYVVDEPGDFAFAWGTLAGHPVAGEERVGLRICDDGQVEMEIRKFSRPAHLFVWLAGPIAHRIQARFSKDAFAAMARALRS